MLLDGARLYMADCTQAVADYGRLLGFAGLEVAGGAVRFQLQSGAVELVQGEGNHALRFSAEHDAEASFVSYGLSTIVEPPAPTAASPDAAGFVAIDHVVVHTTAPERAIATWRDQHGLRLALDREFAQRHLRLQFFRSNHITLEYASPLPPPVDAGDDRFFGISYRVGNLATTRQRLLDAGIDVSDIRTGMRPGTRVATVKSHTHGVPTLILEVNPQPAS